MTILSELLLPAAISAWCWAVGYETIDTRGAAAAGAYGLYNYYNNYNNGCYYDTYGHWVCRVVSTRTIGSKVERA
jgi:hypothetical protein